MRSEQEEEQVVRAIVTMTSVELQYITWYYLHFGQVLVMDDSNGVIFSLIFLNATNYFVAQPKSAVKIYQHSA